MSEPEPNIVRPASMDRNDELLKQANEYIYKEAGAAKLSMYLFHPPAHVRRQDSAIIFFAAGLWDQAVVSQFAPHCRFFAEHGVLCLIAEYRQISIHQSTPVDAVSDAKSAVRWLRLNADSLQIDPGKIAVCGASGGGHIALCAAMAEGFDNPSEPTEISSKPDLVMLFNPVVDTGPKGVGFDLFPDARIAKSVSPLRLIRKGLPPMIVFHGTADRVAPAEATEKFAKGMRRKKNCCDYFAYDGRGHGFFNFNVSFSDFETTTDRMEAFMADNGFFVPLDDSTPRLTTQY